MANDQKVYDMTGCLSKCEKYVYNAEAEDSMLAQEAVFPEHNNTLAILLMLVTGEYEERRQVYCPLSGYQCILVQISVIPVHCV